LLPASFLEARDRGKGKKKERGMQLGGKKQEKGARLNPFLHCALLPPKQEEEGEKGEPSSKKEGGRKKK